METTYDDQVHERLRHAARHGRTDRVLELGPAGVRVGGDAALAIAGPCAVESREQLLATATGLRALGVRMLRGGAYKPRTSPYGFQGLGEDGLRLLAEARELTGMGIVTEVLDHLDVERVAAVADVLQVGARSMQNFALLRRLGTAGRPVLLKRGAGATVAELLCAAEYVIDSGNPDVMLCERGARTFDGAVRGSLDLGSIALLRRLTHLPVIADPSHAAGRADIVAPMAAGALAAGASGVLVEVHADPASALVDGAQSLDLDGAAEMLELCAPVVAATGRELHLSRPRVAA